MDCQLRTRPKIKYGSITEFTPFASDDTYHWPNHDVTTCCARQVSSMSTAINVVFVIEAALSQFDLCIIGLQLYPCNQMNSDYLTRAEFSALPTLQVHWLHKDQMAMVICVSKFAIITCQNSAT
ncbi:hypothetical protein WL883_25775 [Escherichia coli]